MKAKTILFSLLSLLLITACDKQAPKSKVVNPMAGYVQALDKAKAAKAQLLESVEKQRKSLEEIVQ